MRELPFAFDPLQEESQIVPPAEHVLGGPLARREGLELGSSELHEVLREIPRPLDQQPVAVEGFVVGLRGSVGERRLRIRPIVEEALERVGLRMSGEGAQFSQKPSEALLSADAIDLAGAVFRQRHPSGFERGRRVLGEKTQLPYPDEESAIHFELAVRRERADDLFGAALDLAAAESPRRRGDPAEGDAEVVDSFGFAGADFFSRAEESAASQLPQRGQFGHGRAIIGKGISCRLHANFTRLSWRAPSARAPCRV